MLSCIVQWETYTLLYTSNVPDSGCSLGGRLKDSQKVRVSALAADAAALRKPLCDFFIGGYFFVKLCVQTSRDLFVEEFRKICYSSVKTRKIYLFDFMTSVQVGVSGQRLPDERRSVILGT